MALSDEPSEPVFAIAVSTGWMHVYSTVDSLLATSDMDSGPPDAVQFYDVRGRRLAPVFDRSWRLVGLRQAGLRGDAPAVRDLLQKVVVRLQESIDDRLAKSEPAEVTYEQAMRQLPDLSGMSLAECYVRLEPIFGDGRSDEASLKDDGSFWHNFFCHCC